MMTAFRFLIRFSASALLVFWLTTPALAQHGGGGHAGGGGMSGGGMSGGGGRSSGGAAPAAASRPSGHAAAPPASNRPAPRAASAPKGAAPAITNSAKNTSTSGYTPAAGMHLVPGTPTYRWQDPPSGASQAGSTHGVVSTAANHEYFSSATGTSIGTVHSLTVPGRYPITTGCGRGGCGGYGGYNPYYPLGYGYGYGYGYGLGYGFGYGLYPFSPWGFSFGYGLGFGYGYGSGYGYGYGNAYGYDLGYSDNGLGSGSSSASASSSGEYGPYATLDAKTNQPGTLPNPANETTLVLKDGTTYLVTDYWMAGGKLHFVTADNGESTIEIDALDLQHTAEQNSKRGVTFTLRTQDPAQPGQAPGAEAVPASAQAPSQAPAQPPASDPQP